MYLSYERQSISSTAHILALKNYCQSLPGFSHIMYSALPCPFQTRQGTFMDINHSSSPFISLPTTATFPPTIFIIDTLKTPRET